MYIRQHNNQNTSDLLRLPGKLKNKLFSGYRNIPSGRLGRGKIKKKNPYRTTTTENPPLQRQIIENKTTLQTDSALTAKRHTLEPPSVSDQGNQ